MFRVRELRLQTILWLSVVPALYGALPISGQVCVSGEISAATANRTYTGEHAGDQMGIAVGGLPDILGFPTDEGIFLSKKFDGADDSRIYVVQKTAFDPYFYEIPFGGVGRSVAGAGDVDGDGTGDFIVGGDETKVYSGADGSLIVSFTAEAPGDAFGNSVAGVGDIDGNGYDDVAVGAPLNLAGTGEFSGLFPQAGRVYVFLSDPVPPATPIPAAQADVIFTGNPGDWLGFDISSGDFSGDGVADLAMTAIYARTVPGQDTLFGGKAYVYFLCPGVQTPVEFGAGDDPLDDDVNVVIVEDDQPAFFGWSVTAGHDFDGGGKKDLVVGTYKWREPSGTTTGKTYVFYGEDLVLPGFQCDPPAVTIDNESARLRITGRQEAPFTPGGGEGSISFGWSAAIVGDVDGDGKEDLAVGAPFWDQGVDPEFPFFPDQVDVGAAFLFYGTSDYVTPTELTSDDADITIVGEAEGDLFGYGVYSHLFANRDSLADLIIGAPSVDGAAGTDTGRVYVYFPCSEP